AEATLEVVTAGTPVPDVRRVRANGAGGMVSVPVTGSWQVPATLRAACTSAGDAQQCKVNDTAALPGTTLPVPGGLSFIIDTVRPDAPATKLTLIVQFTGRPEVIDRIAPGDVDAPGGDAAARILSVRARQAIAGEIARQTPAGDTLETTRMPERFAMVEAVVQLPADRSPSGFAYRAEPVKPGALIRFETDRYVARGSIVQVTAVQGRE